MSPSEAPPAGGAAQVLKRFVRVGQGLVHYRVAGNGPAVVMLHDSPRSSRLHLETMCALAGRFRVYALDTPGYGNSTPLEIDTPTIADFAEALGEALAALGLSRAPLYATHTSAKIALEHAASTRDGPAILLLDGLSIPQAAPDETFIAAYMRPFRIDATGAYLAAEWTRLRDMLRWFPWFAATPAARLEMEAPPPAWIEAYALDLLSAGPHYSDAYAAAMRYDPRAALRRIASRTIVAAKADDVLFPCLGLVPTDRGANVICEPLGADRTAWLDWLGDRLGSAASLVPPVVAPVTVDGPVYVDLAHGQMLVHRAGAASAARRPLLILETPTLLHARRWQEVLADGRATLLPELPGYGESDPIADPTIEDHADALAAMARVLATGRVDVLALGHAAPLALALAARHPDLVDRLVLDGVADEDREDDKELAGRLCPAFAYDPAGAHLHRIWHMVRDGEVQWPWYDEAPDARRTIVPLFSAERLHDALLDVLKQPASYGDAALAGLRAGALPGRPLLLLELAGDPAYRGVAALARANPGSQVVARPPDIAAAAERLAALLDDDGPRASAAGR